MKLFFLRHGIAAEKGAFTRDADRPLTEEGIKEMKKIAKGMAALEVRPDVIYSSPFVRAKQTAEIAADTLKLGSKLKFHDALQADSNPSKLIQELAHTSRPPESVMLVGHEPTLSLLISCLLTGKIEGILALKKGGLCKLETDDLKFGKCAELKWLLTPKQLMKMGE